MWRWRRKEEKGGRKEGLNRGDGEVKRCWGCGGGDVCEVC